MREQLLFFLGEFHSGAVNQLLHFIGFAVLGYGVGVSQWEFVLLSGIFMVTGNLYNYVRGRYRQEFFATIPLQLGGWLLFVALAYLVANFLQ